jgi:hypothetical protein
MPVLRLNATEIQNPEIDRVAMVKRGANRLPFKMMKGDNEMGVDLHGFLRNIGFAKAEDTSPAVIGVVFAKGADVEGISAVLKEAGIDVADLTKTEADGLVSFAKADGKTDDAILCKYDDSVSFVVSNLKKYYDSYSDSTDFSTVLASESFYPMMSLATSAVQDTVRNCLYDSSDASGAQTCIVKALDGFTSYVKAFTGKIPDTLFKAEIALAKAADAKKAAPVEKTEEAKPEADKVEKTAETEPKADETKVEKTEETKPEGEAAKVEKTEEAKPEGETAVVKTEASEEQVPAWAAALQKSLEGVTTSVADFRKDLDAVKDRVGKVAEMAKSAEEAVHGTVIGGDRADKVGEMQKSGEDHGAPPLLDTGFQKVDFTKRDDRGARRARAN